MVLFYSLPVSYCLSYIKNRENKPIYFRGKGRKFKRSNQSNYVNFKNK